MTISYVGPMVSMTIRFLLLVFFFFLGEESMTIRYKTQIDFLPISYVGHVVSIKNKVPESIIRIPKHIYYSLSFSPSFNILHPYQSLEPGARHHILLREPFTPLISYQRTMYKDLASKKFTITTV